MQDVVAHEVAITEDALAGRQTGPPSDEQTAAQVARFKGCDIAAVLDHLAIFGPSPVDIIE